jgi:drug/metabolite transporter (DMT)-like permease
VGSVALGALLLSQDPSALQLAGVACILGGLLTVAVRPRPRAAVPARGAGGS